MNSQKKVKVNWVISKLYKMPKKAKTKIAIESKPLYVFERHLEWMYWGLTPAIFGP